MSNVHNPINPKLMALSAALGAYIDELGIRREVTYLVYNDIEPNEAVQRVVAYRRRGMIWGMFAIPTMFWGGLFTGWGLMKGIPGLFGLGTSLDLLGAFVAGSLGVLMTYLLFMTHIWSWRRCAKGCQWEDSRFKWLPSWRPASIIPPVPAQPNDTGRAVAAAAVLGIVCLIWIVPVLTGLARGLSALGTLGG